ncbi:hypothetical protein [Nocardia nepalensis]|uniref:hypothetical protein n=1 Tax=Nocardia nepalensis TaxID=3375448 RepID=UPI003B66E52A
MLDVLIAAVENAQNQRKCWSETFFGLDVRNRCGLFAVLVYLIPKVGPGRRLRDRCGVPPVEAWCRCFHSEDETMAELIEDRNQIINAAIGKGMAALE